MAPCVLPYHPLMQQVQSCLLPLFSPPSPYLPSPVLQPDLLSCSLCEVAALVTFGFWNNPRLTLVTSSTLQALGLKLTTTLGNIQVRRMKSKEFVIEHV